MDKNYIVKWNTDCGSIEGVGYASAVSTEKIDAVTVIIFFINHSETSPGVWLHRPILDTF